MFDRVELRADPEVPFTDRLVSAYPQLRQKLNAIKNYRGRLYLRDFGLDAILFVECQFGAANKLIFRSASRMTLRQMAAGVATVFDCDPYELRLARVDPAVDIAGLSMEWARSHVRVASKRCWRETGGSEQNPGKTMYFGRGGDFFRMYDKRLERMWQYECLKRRVRRLPSFEEFSGMSQEGPPVLRIERQIRIGKIPPELDTLGKLEENITSINPFAPVVIHPGGKPEPKDFDYSIRQYLEGIGLRQTIIERGLFNAWALLNARGNATRKAQQLSDFLPPDPECFSPPNLFEMFLESIGRQLSVSKARNETLEAQTAVPGTRSEM
jgi:hypothetical protein